MARRPAAYGSQNANCNVDNSSQRQPELPRRSLSRTSRLPTKPRSAAGLSARAHVNPTGPSQLTIGVIGFAAAHTHDVVQHDIARPRIEGHHFRSIFVSKLAVGDAADIQGENGTNVAEGDIIEIL